MLLVSLLLHILAPILVANFKPVAGWLEAGEIEVPEQKKPIVFEFIEPTPGPEPEEVPETNLASTRKNIARSNSPLDAGKNDLPSSIGDSPLKENRVSRKTRRTSDRPAVPDRDPEPAEAETREDRDERFTLSPSAIRQEVNRSIEERRLDNREGSKTIPGDLSFNTIDFEYAPYLLELKRRVEEHWYPPVAFRGGLSYTGNALIRFAVNRDGSLGLLELVSGADHPSLDTAAMNAVRFGAPFPPLPDDFPEERWEITCTFYYR